MPDTKCCGWKFQVTMDLLSLEKSSSVSCHQLKNSGQIQLWGTMFLSKKWYLHGSWRAITPTLYPCVVWWEHRAWVGLAVPARTILQPRSHEDSVTYDALGKRAHWWCSTRVIVCPIHSDVFLKFLIGSFRITIQGQWYQPPHFYRWGKWGPEKFYHLPKTWSPERNDSILTPESIFSQPEHSSTSCEISRRGPIQRKAENKPREVPLSRKTGPSTEFFIILLS